MKKIYALIPLMIFLTAACAPKASPAQGPDYPQRGAAPQGYGPAAFSRMELAVWNLARAAEKAADEADRYGGYLAHSEVVLEGGRPYARLSIAIPLDQYAVLRAALLDLGSLRRETQTGIPPAPQGQSPAMTGIELFLEPRLSFPTLEAMTRSDHRAVRTFAAAAEILVSLLGFLFDAGIWLAVLVGPFAFLWWAGRGLLRRMHMPVPPADET